MIVTRIEAVTKTKFQVYIDEKFAFVLYKGELSRYRIVAEQEITEELYHKIKKEVILKRAKLRQSMYPEDVIDQATEYVRSFGYIGDSAYARRYIESRQQSKSRKEIYADLCRKGVAKDEIEAAMEECYESTGEMEAVRTLLRKKRFDPENATDAEKQKIYGYLARKGFSYETIRQVIQVSDWNA